MGSKKQQSYKNIRTDEKPFPFWVVVLMFTGATAVFFRAQLFEGHYFWAGFMSDFAEMHLPRQMFAGKYLREFSLPFWNPYTFGGMPFLAELEVGFFYPPSLVMNLLASPNHLPVQALQYTIMFHFWLAGMSMYSLIHLWTKNQMGGIIAGLSYAFSAIFACHISEYIVLYPIAWFPLIIMLFYKATSEFHFQSAIIGGLVLGISMLGGHAQSVLYMNLFLGLFLLWHAANQLYEKQLSTTYWLKYVGMITIFFAVAIGLFSIQLLHSQELAAESTRETMTYEKAIDAAVAPQQLLTAVVPKLFGHMDGFAPDIQFFIGPGYYYWATAFYFGIAALIFGFLGAVQCYKHYLCSFLIFIGVLVSLYALGEHSFIFKAFFHLPLFDLFRGPGRMLFLLVFSMSALAGFGYDALLKKRISFRNVLLISAIPISISLLVTSGTLHGTLGTPVEYRNAIEHYGMNALIVSMCCVAITYGILKDRVQPRIGGLTLCALIIVDLNVFGSAFKNGAVHPENDYLLDPTILSELRSNPPSDVFRVSAREGSVMLLKRNHGLYSGIMQCEGFDPLNLKRKSPPAPTPDDAIDLMNIRYSAVVDKSKQQAYLRKNDLKYPFARLLYKTRISSEDTVVQFMQSGAVDFSEEVVLEKNVDIALPGSGPSPATYQLECREYTDNRIVFNVTTDQAAVLTVSEIWYPAWKAAIDGFPTEVYRANYCFRGVVVPGGTHTIEMFYESSAFIRGRWITMLTLILSFAGIVFMEIQKRRMKAASISSGNE